MKKDRNSFFQSSNFNMSASSSMPNMPNYQMPPMYGNMPNVNAGATQYYQASSTPMGMENVNYAPISNTTMQELEAKLQKLERAINRLDARINKLEGTTYYSKETYETDGNMYMV